MRWRRELLFGCKIESWVNLRLCSHQSLPSATQEYSPIRVQKARSDAGPHISDSRLNKGWSVFPLRDTETHGKCGAGGPESKAEVLPVLKSALRKGSLMAANGSPAFQSTAKAFKKPSLVGVSHLRKVFTPVAALPCAL